MIRSPGQPYLDLQVAAPLSEPMWDHYARLLRLSKAQEQAASDIYVAYREKDWKHRLTTLQPLVDQAASLSRRGVGVEVEATKEFTAILEAVQIERAKLQEIEERFFEDLALILAPVQLDSLAAVSRLRVIDRCAVSSPLAGAMTNLDTVLADLDRSGFDIDRDDRRLRSLMDEYGLVVAEKARLRAREALAEWPERLTELANTLALASSSSPDDRAQAVSLEAEAQRRDKRILERARSMIETNEQFVERLAEVLPSRTVRALRETVGARAYPPLYPDPHDLHGLIEALAQSTGLSDAERDEAVNIAATYATTLDRLLNQGKKRYLDWRTARVLSSARNVSEYPQYLQEMREIDVNRRVFARTALDAIVGATAAARRAHIDAVVAAWRDSAARAEEARHSPSAGQSEWPPINR